ncbi:MAG TPA: alpha/beta hydrolase, partial [Burkholderiales bacterium]|nr:alpha/beta hydrolase [Burkholderiales bacterium]
SYGGGVALCATEKAPQRIRALLLIGSLGPERPEGGLRSLEQLLPLLEPLQRWAAASGFLARPGIRQMGRLLFSGEAPDWWGEHTLSMLALPGVVHTWTMETSHRDVSVLHPEAVTVPVHLLHGTADRLSPYPIAEDLQRRLPISVLVRVEGGSHMLPNTHSTLVVERVRELASDAG